MVAQRYKAGKIGPRESPYFSNLIGGVGFTVGAETGGNTINVLIQLQDARLKDLAERGCCRMYLSDDANGDSLIVTAPSGGVAIGVDGLAIPIVANKFFQLTSEADGDIDLTFIEAGAKTFYLVMILPDGSLVVSPAVTFV
jgi:hypothetical protein